MSKRNETEQLERRLASLGGKIRLQYLVEGFFRVVGIFLLGLVAFYLIDYLTRVPFEIRLVALVSGLAYGLYWFNKKFVSKYRKTLSTEEVSLLVERANPDLKSRMISTLQFEERGVNQGTSKQLVDGLIGQTFEMVKTVSWGSVIDKTWIKPTMKVLLVAICLVVLSVAVSSEHFLIYLKRFVSSTARYPTKTMIVDVNFVNVTKGDIYRIPEGEKIVIEVKAEGVLPVVGKVSIYASSGSESDFDLVQDQNEPSLYRVSLDPILEKVKIEIFLGDCEWGPVSVDIIPRPTITNIKAVVKSPAYTEIGVQTLDTGNLQIIEGSEVEFEVTTDKKCKSFEMYIVNGDVKPASFTKKSDYVWSTNLHVSQSFKYSFQLIDDGDLNSINVPVYTVSVKQDMSPVVQVFKPSSSSEAAPISKIPFLFDVKDDFKVQTIRVFYSTHGRNEQGNEVALVEETEFFAIKDINLKLKQFSGSFDLKQIKSAPGNLVKVRIQALDNKEPTPNEGWSYELKFNILSEEEYHTRLLEMFKAISEKSGGSQKDFEVILRELERLKKN